MWRMTRNVEKTDFNPKDPDWNPEVGEGTAEEEKCRN
jgi:hypothetical protein